MMGSHPNAAVAFGSSAGLGALAVWLLGIFGVDMPVELGPVVGGGIAGAALLFGRNGVVGLARMFWRGSGSQEA